MLAQNFMAPSALGIPDAAFNALVKVLGMLERKEIEEALFDMGRIGRPECGTPGCIMGWGKAITGKRDFDFYAPDAFCKLVSVERRGATTAQAAIALRSYLTTGEPRWAEALAA